MSNFDSFNVSCWIISYSIEPWRNCVWKMSMRTLPSAAREYVGREKKKAIRRLTWIGRKRKDKLRSRTQHKGSVGQYRYSYTLALNPALDGVDGHHHARAAYSVLHRIVKGCYAHSAIPALAFRLATVIAKMYWRGIFSPFSCYSAVRQLRTDFNLSARD